MSWRWWSAAMFGAYALNRRAKRRRRPPPTPADGAVSLGFFVAVMAVWWASWPVLAGIVAGVIVALVAEVLMLEGGSG